MALEHGHNMAFVEPSEYPTYFVAHINVLVPFMGWKSRHHCDNIYNCSNWSFTTITTIDSHCFWIMNLNFLGKFYLLLKVTIWPFRRPIEELLKLLPGPHSETRRVNFSWSCTLWISFLSSQFRWLLYAVLFYRADSQAAHHMTPCRLQLI